MTSVTFDVTVQPVNDSPIAHVRAFQGTEAHEAGGDDPDEVPFVIPFTKAELLNGNASNGEVPSKRDRLRTSARSTKRIK